jgi:hypothetical protein
MKFTVGGVDHELTEEQVIRAMQRVEPEDIREHQVEVGGKAFPPKQVFATVTGRQRQSFTTMEAQRVLSRLGFICRRAGHDPEGRPAMVRQDDELNAEADVLDRLAALEAQVAAMDDAVRGLSARVRLLEG